MEALAIPAAAPEAAPAPGPAAPAAPAGAAGTAPGSTATAVAGGQGAGIDFTALLAQLLGAGAEAGDPAQASTDPEAGTSKSAGKSVDGADGEESSSDAAAGLAAVLAAAGQLAASVKPDVVSKLAGAQPEGKTGPGVVDTQVALPQQQDSAASEVIAAHPTDVEPKPAAMPAGTATAADDAPPAASAYSQQAAVASAGDDEGEEETGAVEGPGLATGTTSPTHAAPSAAGNANAAQHEQHQAAHEQGGGELGRRGSDGGVVDVENTRGLSHGETFEARKLGGEADPSTPSPLPPHDVRDSDKPSATQAPVEPKRAPAGDVERFMRLENMRLTPSLRADGGDMRLHISPEGLGPLEIHVAVRADGVHASLYAAADHTREVLEANRSSLESALGKSNLRLEAFTVAQDSKQQHSQQAPGQQQQEADDRRTWSQMPLAQALELPPLPEPILSNLRGASGLNLRA